MTLPLLLSRTRSAGATHAGVLDAIGMTPLVRLDDPAPHVSLWAKLEGRNAGSSAKARTARAMIQAALASGELRPGDTVVESTSGNLGVGLAQVCAHYGLRLICVTDSRVNDVTLRTMRALGADVRVVSEPDPRTGDLLTARLNLVSHLLGTIPGAFNPNQYANAANPAAHRDGTMAEIDAQLGRPLDHLFIATGTGGTLRGCMDFLARNGRTTQVIAVDVVGSVLFGGPPGPRSLPGMGAARVSPLVEGLTPDRVALVTEVDCVVHCRRLALNAGIMAGASSGGVMAAIARLAPDLRPGSTCAAILPDEGGPYLHTVFDDDWVEDNLGLPPEALADQVRAA